MAFKGHKTDNHESDSHKIDKHESDFVSWLHSAYEDDPVKWHWVLLLD